MSNIYGKQFRKASEGGMADLYLRATIGATGAPTLVAAKSKKIASIARTGVGAYTITLTDNFTDLFSVIPTLTVPSGTPTALVLIVRSHTVNAAAKQILVAFFDGTTGGTAAEIPSGATLGLKFELKDSGA